MSEYPTYLIHYGVPGQRWGVRQYQFEDGTWTEEGKRRRRIGDDNSGFSDVKTGKKFGSYKSGSSDSGDFVKSIKKDVDTINGGSEGHEFGFNRQENCAFCTMAYELRRRGLDVRAQESIQGVATGLSSEEGAYGRVIPNFSKVSSSARKFSETSYNGMHHSEYKSMVDTLLKDGDSRGFISCQWKDGMGGHIFNYEVNNGKLYFIDAQNGTINNADTKEYNNVFQNAFNIETLRSDNLKINEEKAKKYYTEDTLSDIKINDIRVKESTATAVGVVLGLVGGVAATAAVAAATGYLFPKIMIIAPGIAALVALPYTLKANKLDREEYENLKNKWESEGRLENRWYEQRETKKKVNTLPDAKQSRIKALVASGKTQEEVAKILGVSISTVKKYK